MALFDHHIRRIRAARVKKLLPSADFLFEKAADGVADRLADVTREFPKAALVDAPSAGFADALRARRGGGATDIVETDDERLILPDRDYDLIVSAMALHRMNDPVGLLTQMRLALKPDGLMLAACFGGRTLHELRAAFGEAEAEVEGGMSPRVSPMGEVRDLGGLLQRAGFALPVADVDRFDVAYQTPFHLMRDLRAMGEANPLAARRKTLTRRATMMRMAEIYAANFGRPDGRIEATFEIVFLTGWSPDESQQKPLRPGSASTRLADALGVVEKSAGEKAGE